MRGLILKDLLSLKGTLMILAVFVAFYAIIGFVGDNSSMVTGVLAIVIMMLPANSISYDEFYHWDRLVLTMPVSRKMVVQSKYLLCFLLAGFVLVFGTISSALIARNIMEGLITNFFVALVSLLISVIALPCMLKWGAQRGRLVIVLLCGVAGSLMALVMFSLKWGWGDMAVMSSAHLSEQMLIAILILCTVAVVVISYFISCKLYLRKQF